MSDPGTGDPPETGASRRPGRGRAGPRPADAVLADRIAAALVRHEPGWRLPRHTVLARRYQVSTAEIDVALGELAARHLIRRLPDGQLYRVSPAEYLIPLEGVPGLGTLADPMGGQVICQSRQAALSEVPDDIGWALRVPPADQVAVIRTQWTTPYGEPAAFCTTYLVRDIAAPFLDTGNDPALTLAPPPPLAAPAHTSAAAPDTRAAPALGQPRAVHLEVQPPTPALAKRLRLAPGQPAALVTARFDDPSNHRPVALTSAALRPDLFRIVVQSANLPPPHSGTPAWSPATGDQET